MIPKERIISIIEEIKSNEYVSQLDVYEANDIFWDYYFSLTGYFNGNYFLIYFMSHQGNFKIEIPRHVNENITLLKKQFKI